MRSTHADVRAAEGGGHVFCVCISVRACCASTCKRVGAEGKGKRYA